MNCVTVKNLFKKWSSIAQIIKIENKYKLVFIKIFMNNKIAIGTTVGRRT